MKTLFIYSSERSDKFRGTPSSDFPDSSFYGFFYMKLFGVNAKIFEFKNVWGGKILRILPFSLKHALSFFVSGDFDLIFGPTVIFMMPFKKIFGSRRKFILLNLSLVRMLKTAGFIKRKYLASMIRELHAIICLAHYQVEYLTLHFPDLAHKIFYVPLGIDTVYHSKGRHGGNYLISVGKDNGRDYHTVIEAAKRLPDEHFKLICSPRNLLGIGSFPSNVEVILGMPMDGLKKEYENAKAILIITKDDDYNDGSDCSGQTVLLDSMASGLPIIASRRKSLAGYVEDGKEALFVNFYDPDDLVQKIKTLGNKIIREQLGSAARLKAENCFSSKKMAENLSKIFKSISNTK